MIYSGVQGYFMKSFYGERRAVAMKRTSFWLSICCGVVLLMILSTHIGHARSGMYYYSYYSGAKYHEAVRRITTPTFTLNRVKKIEQDLYRNRKKIPYPCLKSNRCTDVSPTNKKYREKKKNRSSLHSPHSVTYSVTIK